MKHISCELWDANIQQLYGISNGSLWYYLVFKTENNKTAQREVKTSICTPLAGCIVFTAGEWGHLSDFVPPSSKKSPFVGK